ncbi:hypothetical protein ACTWP4_19605 [Gracilibacillus sp. D59]|uniref:hypothetical protein n=1 Tax=Gracilibacillus sp. D59 TaxID=3457434 RepID=UPI003FCE2126
MKKFLLLMLVGSFIIVACNSESNNGNGNTDDSEAQADWDVLSLKELKERVDVIAFFTVEDVEIQEKSNGINAQISTLELTKTISGTVSGEVKLDQSTNYVEKGEDYLLFLEQNGTEGYYYVPSPSGVIQEKDGMYNSDKLGGDSKLNKEEMEKLISD